MKRGLVLSSWLAGTHWVSAPLPGQSDGPLAKDLQATLNVNNGLDLEAGPQITISASLETSESVPSKSKERAPETPLPDKELAEAWRKGLEDLKEEVNFEHHDAPIPRELLKKIAANFQSALEDLEGFMKEKIKQKYQPTHDTEHQLFTQRPNEPAAITLEKGGALAQILFYLQDNLRLTSEEGTSATLKRKGHALVFKIVDYLLQLEVYPPKTVLDELFAEENTGSHLVTYLNWHVPANRCPYEVLEDSLRGDRKLKPVHNLLSALDEGRREWLTRQIIWESHKATLGAYGENPLVRMIKVEPETGAFLQELKRPSSENVALIFRELLEAMDETHPSEHINAETPSSPSMFAYYLLSHILTYSSEEQRSHLRNSMTFERGVQLEYRGSLLNVLHAAKKFGAALSSIGEVFAEGWAREMKEFQKISSDHYTAWETVTRQNLQREADTLQFRSLEDYRQHFAASFQSIEQIGSLTGSASSAADQDLEPQKWQKYEESLKSYFQRQWLSKQDEALGSVQSDLPNKDVGVHDGESLREMIKPLPQNDETSRKRKVIQHTRFVRWRCYGSMGGLAFHPSTTTRLGKKRFLVPFKKDFRGHQRAHYEFLRNLESRGCLDILNELARQKTNNWLIGEFGDLLKHLVRFL